MSGRLLLASNLALTLAVLVARPCEAAAQPPDPDAPGDVGSPAPPAETPPESPAPGDVAAPEEAPPGPTEAPAEPPPELADPPAATEPTRAAPAPETPRVNEPPPPRSAPTPPPTQTPTRAEPPASEGERASGEAAASPPEAKPGGKETVREATRRRTEADKKQRFRHGGFIVDARVGGTGCMRTTCQGSEGHRAAPGLHLGGFVGFNLFGLIEIGLEGGWNSLRPRDVAGRNAMALYGLDPTQLQQAITGQQSLPFPTLIDFSSLDVSSATSRAVDVGPSLRIHLLRKGRGLLFVGAGVHYQLYRNDYKVPGGDLRVDMHGASLPLRVGAGVFLHRNLALMGEFSYAPAIFGAMSFRLGDDRGVAPLKVIEDATGVKMTSNLPHFWNFALTLRFRL